jgi:hypothetical protein
MPMMRILMCLRDLANSLAISYDSAGVSLAAMFGEDFMFAA